MISSFFRWNLLLTDTGFLLYWCASAFAWFPPEWLYKDHDNPILQAWNWSFAPVDLAASVSGLGAMALLNIKSATAKQLAIVSATLTLCAGLMAISFWSLRRDFDLAWWAPNLYLVAWPLIAACSILTSAQPPNLSVKGTSCAKAQDVPYVER